MRFYSTRPRCVGPHTLPSLVGPHRLHFTSAVVFRLPKCLRMGSRHSRIAHVLLSSLLSRDIDYRSLRQPVSRTSACSHSLASPPLVRHGSRLPPRHSILAKQFFARGNFVFKRLENCEPEPTGRWQKQANLATRISKMQSEKRVETLEQETIGGFPR